MSAEPRLTVSACRHEMDRRMAEAEDSIDEVVGPTGCLASIKKQQNRLLGGVGAVVGLLGIAAAIIAIIISGITDSTAEAKSFAMSANEKVHEVETTNAVLKTELKNLSSKIKDQSAIIDKQTIAMGKLVVTIQDLRLEIRDRKGND